MGGARLARCIRPWRIANSRMRNSKQVDPAAHRSRYVHFQIAPHPATSGVRLLLRPPLPRAEPSWPLLEESR
jgi:hypothetical protein